MCAKHYRRIKNNGTLTPLRQPRTGHCEATGCEAPIYARRVCARHYERLREHGSANYAGKTPAQRFWEKVEKTEGCWNWRRGWAAILRGNPPHCETCTCGHG